MKEYIYEKRTIGHILEDKAQTIAAKVFLVHKGKNVTYEEMNLNVNRIANSLLRIGVQKNDKVCLIMANSVEFLYAWFALAKIGAVMVPVNHALKGQLLSYMINNSDASVVIVDSELADRLAFIQEELEQVKRVIILGAVDTSFSARLKVSSFSDLYDGDAAPPPGDVRFHDPMTILYTSGTTGPSKGAVLSHAHYYFVAQQAVEHLKYDEHSVIYSCLPLFHANATVFGAMGTMLAEGKFVLATRFSLSTFWDEIKACGATHTTVVGPIAPLLWRQPEREDDAENPLKVFNGAPLIPETTGFERRFGLKLLTGYGTTETGCFCYSPFEEAIRRGSCGKPISSCDVRIFDDNDIELPVGSIGELVVRGREPYALMDGYYKMPEATVRAFRNLWYHTGDFAYRDEDGYFYFVDRKKDALRRRGENISSSEVEAVINSHPKVLESAVFAVPSELGEDDVMTVVVLREAKTMPEEELIRWCEDRMAYFAVPRYVEIRDALPKTPTLRIEKYKLRQEGVTSKTWDREKSGYKLKR